MRTHFNTINMHIDDHFYRSLNAVSKNIEIGLNFNNIYSRINSPTGNLIDYNVQVLAYNGTLLGVIGTVALLALGVNCIGCALTIGALLFIRYKIQKNLNNFWYQKAANVAVEHSVEFADKAAKLFNWVTNEQNQVSKERRLQAGKDCGPFGLIKTVSSLDELISKIKSEAKLDSESDEQFSKRMKNLPANTALFLSFLKINAYLQSYFIS